MRCLPAGILAAPDKVAGNPVANAENASREVIDRPAATVFTQFTRALTMVLCVAVTRVYERSCEAIAVVPEQRIWLIETFGCPPISLTRVNKAHPPCATGRRPAAWHHDRNPGAAPGGQLVMPRQRP